MSQDSQAVRDRSAFVWGGITALLFGFGSIFAKQLSYGNTPIFVTLITHLMALGIVTVIFLLYSMQRSRPRWAKIVLHWRLILLAGVVGLGLPVLLAVLGFKDTNVIRGAILLQCQTVVALIYGALRLGEHIQPRQVGGIALVLIGGVLTVFERPSDSLLWNLFQPEDIFLLVSAICFGISFSWVKRLNLVFDVVTVSLLRLIGSAVFLSILTVVWESGTIVAGESLSFGTIGAYALTNFVFASLTLNETLRRSESWRAAAMLHLSPIFTIGGAMWLLGVSPSLTQLIGIVILIIGNIWIEHFHKKRT